MGGERDEEHVIVEGLVFKVKLLLQMCVCVCVCVSERRTGRLLCCARSEVPHVIYNTQKGLCCLSQLGMFIKFPYIIGLTHKISKVFVGRKNRNKIDFS